MGSGAMVAKGPPGPCEAEVVGSLLQRLDVCVDQGFGRPPSPCKSKPTRGCNEGKCSGHDRAPGPEGHEARQAENQCRDRIDGRGEMLMLPEVSGIALP